MFIYESPKLVNSKGTWPETEKTKVKNNIIRQVKTQFTKAKLQTSAHSIDNKNDGKCSKILIVTYFLLSYHPRVTVT